VKKKNHFPTVSLSLNMNTCGFIGAFIVQTQLSEPASK